MFGVFNFASLPCPEAGSSRRSAVGLEERSFDVDVEDELLPELDDKPGTPRGTKLSVLHLKFLPLFGQPWFLTTDPLIDITILFEEFAQCQNGRRVIAYWHCHEKLKIVNVYLCFLVFLHFPLAVTTVVVPWIFDGFPVLMSSSSFAQHVLALPKLR